MNEKLNIQELIDLLAEKHGMSRKNADGFVKEFFLLIEESLEKDKYVKIKGLGTFKLIDVDSRESVKINTGERFQIEGYTKVSFTPEPSLKDTINKPFGHFETVVLNEGTILEDTPLENENEEEEDTGRNTEATVSETKMAEVTEEIAEVTEEIQAAAETENVSLPEEETKVPEEEVELAEEEVKQEEAAEIEEQTEVDEQKSEDASVDSTSMKYFIGIVVFVVLLCGGAVAYMYFPDLLESTPSKPLENKEVKEKTEIAASKEALSDSMTIRENVPSVPKDTVAEALAANAGQKEVAEVKTEVPVPKKKEKKPAAAPFKPDSVGYTIVGTEATYTIKEGETLTRVALHFYGTKALWPYIVKHNPGVIKNPDNVPYGTVIKIPKLKKKQ